MGKLNAIIIDDEERNVSSLAADIKKYCPEIQLVALCSSSKEGLKAIKEHQPELLFLDIEMPWMNGFELLETVEINFDVIFTTAYDQYAVKAFRMSAIDYLLKPIDKNELQQAVRKVIEKQGNFSREQLVNVQANLKNNALAHRIGVPTREGIDFIAVEEIIYCEASGNYTHIVLMDKKRILISKPVKNMEQLLNDYNFCRVHQSYLINLNHLTKYYRGDGGYVELVDGSTINVSRSKKTELLQRIKV